MRLSNLRNYGSQMYKGIMERQGAASMGGWAGAGVRIVMLRGGGGFPEMKIITT